MRPLVLLAEHDDDLRDTCAEYLRAHGLRVEEAADAKQALEKTRLLVPTVLVIDMSLARAGGAETMRLLEPDEAAGRTVIALSADDSEENRRNARRTACCTFMVKTRLPERLLSAVRAGLGD
jgi:two-component system cell cycle response regulator DivK